MDLSKILNQNNLSHLKSPSSLEELGKKFFSQLLSQLETDLQYLSQQHQIPQFDYFSNTRVFHGNLDENLNKNSINYSCEKRYLFLQLPNLPGFLIESEKEPDIYKMYRATRVISMQNSDLGKMIRPEMFVLKSRELEEFRILDESFVRTLTSDRTLSVKQMSEMLLLLVESVRE